MADYPSGLAAKPAEEAVRLIALTQLDAASTARRRLADPDDVEALHDLRVALRRLRSTIRAYRAQLDVAVSRKLRRRLRDLARATGVARDAEVQLAWIRTRRGDVPAGRRAGLPWLIARLTARRDAAYATMRRDVPLEFDRLETRLRKGLAAAPPRGASSLGAAVAERAQQHAAEVARLLDLLRVTQHEADAHAARIQAKRLRYLLEPLMGAVPQTGPVVTQLKALQDLLGELHDVHVLIVELGDAVADAAAQRARNLHDRALGRRAAAAPGVRVRERPASAGLLALASLAFQAEKALLARVTVEWLDRQRIPGLVTSLKGLADVLVPAPPLSPPPRLRRPPKAARTQAPLPSRYTHRTPP